VRETVARLLHEIAGARVDGVVDLGNPAAPVLRITLDAEYAGIGRTVIAKLPRRAGAGWNGDPAYLDNERRALRHLERVGVGLAPRILACDENLGVVLMTDLGSGPSLQELLIAGAAAPAERGLVGMAAAVGTVHAARSPERFRAARGVPFLDDPLGSWHELRAAADDLGLPSPARACTDVEALAGALADERFRAFTHGDLTPGNAVVIDGGTRLLDFEAAGVRHLGIDAGCLRLSFPQYGRWAVLPGPVLARMDRAYRAELVEGLPAVADDWAYEQLVAEGCLAWAVVRASRLRLIASGDQSVRRRTQIVHTLTAATGTAGPTGLYPALTRWLDDLVEAMTSRWDEARLAPRVFRAFAPL
jgi:tRNA A-37 threonylcarbamoyl transferase component Bud32